LRSVRLSRASIRARSSAYEKELAGPPGQDEHGNMSIHAARGAVCFAYVLQQPEAVAVREPEIHEREVGKLGCE
jgi:hypothetical protein